MAGDQLTTLMRAVAGLRIGDGIDIELVDALKALIAPGPPPTPAGRDVKGPADAQPRIARPAEAANESVASPPQPAARPQHEPAGQPATSRPSQKRDTNLIARPSSLEKIEERADLVAPQRTTTYEKAAA